MLSNWVVSEGGTIDTRERVVISRNEWGFRSLHGVAGEFLFDRFPAGDGSRPAPYPPGEYVDPVRHEIETSESWVHRVTNSITRLEPRE